MSIHWTTNHGRGPGFRSRAERKRQRNLRLARMMRANSEHAIETIDSILRTTPPIVSFVPAPWYLRALAAPRTFPTRVRLWWEGVTE